MYLQFLFFDRLSDSLVNHILQITVQESSKLLSDAANLNKNNFEEMLSSLPVSIHDRSTRVLSLFTYKSIN